MHFLRATPILGALLAQALAALVVAGLLQALMPQLTGRFGIDKIIWGALVVQALLSAGLTRALGLAVWWHWIALAFPFAVALALAAGSLPAWPFGLAFLLLYLFFSNTARERVPLYLTNRATIEALRRLMAERGATRFSPARTSSSTENACAHCASFSLFFSSHCAAEPPTTITAPARPVALHAPSRKSASISSSVSSGCSDLATLE